MNLKRTLMIVTVLMAACFVNYSSKAADYSAGTNSYDSEGMPPIRKLSRGIVNVAFGALEVPMNMVDTNEEEGGIAAVVYGTLKGVTMCVAREFVGVLEIVTFLMPLPGTTSDPHESGWGYGPIIRPEWVVSPGRDWSNFIYPDYPPQ